MATVFIEAFDRDMSTNNVIGVTLRIQYGTKNSEITMLGIPPLSAQDTDAGLRAEILALGQALMQAAQTPQAIHGYPQPRSQS